MSPKYLGEYPINIKTKYRFGFEKSFVAKVENKTDSISSCNEFKTQDILNLQTGFTLIEIAAALAILSVSIVIVLQMFSGSLRSIKVSDDYLRASILAQNKMKELQMKYRYFIENEGGFKEDERYRWSLKVENHDVKELYQQFEYLKIASAEPVSVDKITLKVSWDTDNGERSVELVTLKTMTLLNQTSNAVLQGKYPSTLKNARSFQFGEQDIPSGQSGRDYYKANLSGNVKQVRERSGRKVNICGAPTTPSFPGGNGKVNICGAPTTPSNSSPPSYHFSGR